MVWMNTHYGTVKQNVEPILSSVLSELTVNATLRMMSDLNEMDIKSLTQQQRDECLSLLRVTLNLYLCDKERVDHLMDNLHRVFKNGN